MISPCNYLSVFSESVLGEGVDITLYSLASPTQWFSNWLHIKITLKIVSSLPSIAILI